MFNAHPHERPSSSSTVMVHRELELERVDPTRAASALDRADGAPPTWISSVTWSFSASSSSALITIVCVPRAGPQPCRQGSER